MIPYGRQWLAEEEIAAVVEILKGDWLTQGPKVEAFEKAFAESCEAQYAVAVSNGTAALHIAAMACGLRPGDEGITSPNTFLASANCLAYCGATPKFADIQSDTYCLNPSEITKHITPRTKLIIPVHFAGQPCDMETIWDIAQKNKVMIIEDAAHAFGSKWQDTAGCWHKVGSCSHSHMTIFSFHPVKTITTGEGGIIVTNDRQLARKCRLLRNHGITKDPSEFSNHEFVPFIRNSRHRSFPSWYYEMQTLGFNYRITDIQCALGLVQIKRLPSFRYRRREIWNYYNERLSDIEGFIPPREREGVCSCWHLYVAQTTLRDSLLAYLRSQGIGAHAMYIPVHLQPYYQRRFGYKRGDFPKAESYFNRCLVLPLYAGMSKETLDCIIKAVRTFYENS